MSEPPSHRDFPTTEPILTPSKNRFGTFPVQNQEVWALYKRAESCFWTLQDIDLSRDRSDWETLTTQERDFICQVLAHLAAFNWVVVDAVSTTFFGKVQMAEARTFYGFQIAVEDIHCETFNFLLSTFTADSMEKERFFRAPCMARKVEWARHWMSEVNVSFAEKLIALVCMEGIFSASSSCALYWVKKRGKMPGLSLANDLVSRDEGIHVDFSCLLYSMLKKKLPEEHVKALVREAMNIEKDFISKLLPCELLGMNSKLMTQYVESFADQLLGKLCCQKLFNVENPFDWMTTICLETKTNFLEASSTRQSALVTSNLNHSSHSFLKNQDF